MTTPALSAASPTPDRLPCGCAVPPDVEWIDEIDTSESDPTPRPECSGWFRKIGESSNAGVRTSHFERVTRCPACGQSIAVDASERGPLYPMHLTREEALP